MSVTRPTLSRDSVAPGTSRDDARGRRGAGGARWPRAPARCRRIRSARRRRRRESARPRRSRRRSPPAARRRAIGWLQPIGRPVTAITGRPAARSAASAATTPIGIAPSVVSVSSMSVSTPPSVAQPARVAARPGLHGGRNHRSIIRAATAARIRRRARMAAAFRGALQGTAARAVSQARNSSYCNRAHPHDRVLVGEFCLPSVGRRAGSLIRDWSH